MIRRLGHSTTCIHDHSIEITRPFTKGDDAEADGWEGWDAGPADSLLLDRLDQAQRLVRAARLLAKHGMTSSVADLRDSDRGTVSLLLRQLLVKVSANVSFTDSR